MVLAAAAAAAAVLAVGIARPALGEDESILVTVARWPRQQFVAALEGQEAPIAPFYLFMRVWLRVSTVEWWIRLPSLVAMVAAVALLAGWVERRLSRAAALAAVAVLLCLPSLTRFGQEARPYGFAVCAAVLCTAAWWRARTTTGRGPTIWYAASIVVLGLAQALALSLVAAQLAVSLWRDPAAPSGSRHRPWWRTWVPAGAGLAVAAPFVGYAAGHGTGNEQHLAPSLHNVWSIAAGALSGEPREAALVDHVAWVVLALAVVGAWRLRRPEQRFTLAYCWLWALVPVDVLLLSAPLRPTLTVRYLLFTTPAWAVLAGTGCLTLASVVPHVLRRSTPRPGDPAREGPGGRSGVVVTVVATLVATLPVAGLLALAWPRQVLYRTAGGHPFGDVRPAVARLGSPELRPLPVVALPSPWYLVQALAYDPGLTRRLRYTDGPRMADGRMLLTNAPAPSEGPGDIAVLVPTGDPATARAIATEWATPGGLSVVTVLGESDWSVVLLHR